MRPAPDRRRQTHIAEVVAKLLRKRGHEVAVPTREAGGRPTCLDVVVGTLIRGAGCGVDPEAPPLVEAQSFTAAATITLSARGPFPGQTIAPLSLEMLLRLDPMARKLTIAQRATAQTVDVRPVRDGAAFETGAFMLPIAGLSGPGPGYLIDDLRVD